MNEKELWERMTASEQSLKSLHHRVANFERLTESIYTLATEVKAMRADIDRLVNDVDELQNKPARRMALIVTTIITAFTSGVVGYVLAKIIGG